MLKERRGISFEEIVLAIEDGCTIDILRHPNTERYPNQLIYLIDYRDYIWVVPHVVDEINDETFLKTIYPSRKLTKYYRDRRKNQDGE